jgi:hypothetical protein
MPFYISISYITADGNNGILRNTAELSGTGRCLIFCTAAYYHIVLR